MSFRVSSAMLSTCAATVATATPATPQRKSTTNTTSSTMLLTQPATIYRKGLNESPTARSMLDSIFSTMTKGTPIK